MYRPSHPDILIAGGGVIGLALALELYTRGARVTVLERDYALHHASSAAAGMLAVDDPHNPPALLPLAQLSASLYPSFLDRVGRLSGLHVPFQTSTTIQYSPDGSTTRLPEFSLDPRQLAAALATAVKNASIPLLEGNPVIAVAEERDLVCVLTGDRQAGPARAFRPGFFVNTTGAWASSLGSVPVRPVKGQMLRVGVSRGLHLTDVHRSQEVYIVPRLYGPQAGSALVGATVEDAGFDTSTHPADLALLRAAASRLVPELACESTSPLLEAWAGLRPCTPDGLPLLGAAGARDPGRHFIAAGHFRNGILLAPATAAVLADLIEARSPALDLSPFAPGRFARIEQEASSTEWAPHTCTDIRPCPSDNGFRHTR